MVKKILVVCNLNRVRSPFIAKRLQEYYNDNDMDIDVSSAGVNVHHVRKHDDRQPLSKTLARNADVILPTDYSVTFKIIKMFSKESKYSGSKFGEARVIMEKIHPLRISDAFLPEGYDFDPDNMDRKDVLIREYINRLDPKEASDFVERLYQSELEGFFKPQKESYRYPNGLLKRGLEYLENQSDIYHENGGNTIYPMELLDKALDHRIPRIVESI